MMEYNGHRSWNAWNVALWIGNDESLYCFAIECLKDKTLTQAVNRFMRAYGYARTPDGAVFNRLSVKLALAGLLE